MNHSTKVWIIILIGLVLFTSYLTVLAHAEYFVLFKTFDTKPIICVHSYPKDFYPSKHIVIKSINEWKTKLGDKFDTQVIFPKSTEQKTKCNIQVVHTPTLTYKGQDYSYALGITDCSKNYCVLQLNTGLSFYPENTLKHELGHAFGLGHRTAENPQEFPALILTNDVMINQNGPFRWVTQEDINVMKFIYGDDGWLPPNKQMTKYQLSK